MAPEIPPARGPDSVYARDEEMAADLTKKEMEEQGLEGNAVQGGGGSSSNHSCNSSSGARDYANKKAQRDKHKDERQRHVRA